MSDIVAMEIERGMVVSVGPVHMQRISAAAMVLEEDGTPMMHLEFSAEAGIGSIVLDADCPVMLHER